MIKCIIFDFDGVFTNGNIFYLSNGEQIKYYNVKDGMAIKLLKNNKILTGLISSHNSQCTLHIANHLKFNKVSIGSNDSKLNILSQWNNELNLNWNQIAYIGDDIVDIKCLNMVGLSACPSDAVQEVKKICKYICKNEGGKGAVREFSEYIINLNTESLNHN